MPARRRRPLPWLAASSAALALAAAPLAVPALAPPPPWQLLAPACIGAAALLAALAAWRARQQARALDAASARAALAESERDALQRDVHLRERLERELVQAKQAAEAAVMAKGEFLATMSHEIRTPLNGIIPMLELIARGQLGTEQREMLRAANDSSLQLLRIVDDILDYSKLEANRLELEITSFNLRELLDGMLQLMQRAAEAKGLRVALQLDPAVRLPVRGDPLRLRQVLSNLIGNAIKFTARGSVELRVRRLGETPAQHLLRFEVRDTGIGISPEQQERLFRSFTQADASTTRLYGGTGLGLAICKRIVDLMGGRIGVESGSDQGATFWFEIPLLKVIGDLPQAQGSLPRLHALLVGADQRLYQRLKTLLPNWGVQLSKVDSTQEALERLRAGNAAAPPYDLVIGDLDGLRQSARALQRAVTRLPAPHAMRLIWLYGDTEIPEEIRAHGALLSRQAADLDLRGMLALAPAAALASAAAPALPEEPASDPQRDAAAASASTTATAADPAEAIGPASPAADYRLLLVEDNPVNLLVAQKLLDVLGYRSDSVADGAAALAQLATQAYDLVLMDCQMPVLDGYAATRQWRQSEAAAGRTRLPIVAMTANAMAGDRQRCLEAGMDDYLSKPVGRELLAQCLQRWLPHRAANAAPAQAAPESAALPADAETASAQTAQSAQTQTQTQTQTAAIAASAFSNSNSNSNSDNNSDGATSTSISTADLAPLPPTPLPVLDIAVLDELRELAGSATTAQIVELFLGDAPQLIQRLEQAAVTPQLEPLRDAAHTLKSSAANVGALALSAAALRIEAGVRAHQLERPAVAVALVIAEFARARLALNGYRNTLRDAVETPAP
ncbi:ATP-binding protein [Xanthomonas sp. 1678]|uniref:hybrid sensor histidine kinase/response regulator n=1 Tax=Xanthomonas sp. 1678 TaxID=3158788 RepID=UPI0028632446|nr:signal transduction histidine kinase/CheY-like chemotaxis protein/HPt (histidine-containing phosphotransfer) domain-containing protein [Xanthomonas translucens]